MSAPARIVFERWTDPVAASRLKELVDVELVQLDFAAAVEGWRSLAVADAYQVPSPSDYRAHPNGEQWRVDHAFLDRTPALLVVCSAGAGYENVDVGACTAAGVLVCNNSGPGVEAVAEHALGMMLNLAKNITVADRQMRAGATIDRVALKGGELAHKTVSIIGFGRTGVRLGELCQPFGVELLADDPYLDDATITARGASPVNLDEALARADFVNVMCPLTNDTYHLLDAQAFARMKPSAYFITTARGGVHDEDALYEALTQGTIAGAGVDVFKVEPPAHDHPLLSLDNVVATPHIAGITREATHSIAVATADQWASILTGEVPPRVINPEAWPGFAERFRARFGSEPTAPRN